MKTQTRVQELPVSSLMKNSAIVRLIQEEFLPQATPKLLQLLSSLAPGIAAHLADRIFTTPPRYVAPASEMEILKTGHRFRVAFRGEELTAWSWGDGPTVLLVHGWAGRGGQMGPFVRPLLDAGFSVVLFDAPGHGLSPGRRSSMIDFAEAIQVMARRVGPVHAIIAHSMGAPASALAMKRGTPVSRVVFIGSPVSAAGAARKFGDRLGLPESVIARMRRRIELRYLTRWDELEMSSLAYAQTSPLLVVHDRDDRDVSVKAAEMITDLWKGSQSLITEGLGHRKVLRTREVIDRVVSFIQG